MDLIFILKLIMHICPHFGIFFNLLAIWLILTKTPQEMVKHSRILLQNCIFDIVFILQELIGTSVGLILLKLSPKKFKLKDDCPSRCYYN